MRRKGIYQYYVEGEDEKSVVNVLKRELGCIESGRVETFNVVQNKITTTRIRTLRQGTSVVLVYDTDVEANVKILEQNIEFLKRQSAVKEVICIPQVRDLEDELTSACDVKCFTELTKSGSKKDFKRDLISCTNLGQRLNNCGFDVLKFWNKILQNRFTKFGNGSDRIKIG